MLRHILKIFFITIILFNIGLSNNDKNTLLNLKVKIDNEFRQTLDMDPNLYKIWIGTKDGSQELSEPIINSGKSKTYIPGLPGSAPLIEEVYTSNKVSEIFNYIVDIYIDDEYNQSFQINRIKGVILDVWPAFGKGNRLEENVFIKVMSFQAPIGSELEESELSKLEEKQRDLESSLSELESRYSELESVKSTLENENQELKMSNLESDKALKMQIEDLKIQINQEKEEKRSEQLEKKLEGLVEQFNSTIIELEEKNDVQIALEEQIEMLEQSIDDKEQNLQRSLLEELQETISKQEESNKEQSTEIDQMIAFRLEYLENQFKNTQQFKDSLLNKYGQKLDNIYAPVDGCMNPAATNYDPRANRNDECGCLFSEDSGYFTRQGCKDPAATNFDCTATGACIDCCKYVSLTDSTSMNSTQESSGAGWVLWLAIGLLGLLIVLSLIAIFTNKKKVIYLKPKDKKSGKSKSSNKEKDSDTTQEEQAVQASAPATPQAAPTAAPIDEGVMQSEIRTQRQSAVAMSAGQKEGATQIVKDWLEESKNEENSEE